MQFTAEVQAHKISNWMKSSARACLTRGAEPASHGFLPTNDILEQLYPKVKIRTVFLQPLFGLIFGIVAFVSSAPRLQLLVRVAVALVATVTGATAFPTVFQYLWRWRHACTIMLPEGRYSLWERLRVAWW
jgi:hypothetical protein